MKKYALILATMAMVVLTISDLSAQILTFENSALGGSEATASSNYNDPNLSSSTLSRGSGLTASANAQRYNATDWATTGTLGASDYMEFTITPNTGYEFSVSSIVINFQRSGTGPKAFAIRSSEDGYATDLATQTIGDVTSTNVLTFTFSQTSSCATPITYRFYGYNSEAASGSGGIGDGGGDDLIVNGTVSACGGGCSPDLTLGTITTSAGSITEGTTNNVIYGFSITTSAACAATLSGLNFTTTGTAVNSNFNNMKVWYSADNTFNSGTDTQLGSSITTGMGAGSHTLGGSVSQTIAISTTGYIFITADLPCGATAGNTISVSAITSGDLTFSTAPNSVSGSTSTGGLKTIASVAPNNVTGAATSSCSNGSSTVSWTLPTGCYDNVLVVAKPGSAVTLAPSGTGGSYTANTVYGSGTAYDGGFVVYKNNGSTVTVTGLTNGTTYYFTIFTRNGSSWSSGVTVSCTPTLSYCTPSSWSTADSEIENVELTGENNSINNNTTSSCTNTVQDYTSMSADLEQGGTYTLNVQFGDCGSTGIDFSGAGGVWIDWNGDGDFSDAGEEVGTTSFSAGSNITHGFTINVSGTQPIGTYRMRIVQDESGSTSTIDPCASPGFGAIEDYTIEIVLSCTPTHSISSFIPTSGPIGTLITITGTGFTASTSVEFYNGVAATIVSQSSTELVVEVPTGTSTGGIKVTENSCKITTSDFTIIEESGSCSAGGNFTDLIISEVYDGNSGNIFVVELYNPTTSDIGLENYSIVVNGMTSQGYHGNNVGNNNDLGNIIVPAGGLIVLDLGTDNTSCGYDYDIADHTGINESDVITLQYNGTTVDIVETPNTTGYSILRDPTATGPTATWNASDWTTNTTESCTDIGNFSYTPYSPPTVSTIADNSDCSGIDYGVTGTLGTGGTALTYQWYYNDGVATGWTAVTSSDPANLNISGETSDNLTITSGSSDISTVDGYQFYCEVTQDGTCSKMSVASDFISTGERYYRSAGTGDWTNLSIWEMGPSTSGPWTAACTYPNATNSDYISIESGHTVTIPEASSLQANQIIVQIGGILQLEETLTIPKEATGADLSVQGRLNDWGSSSENIVFNGGATWELGTNGDIYKYWSSSVLNLKDNYEGGISSIPATANWYYHHDGSNTNIIVNSVDMFYPNLYYENSDGTSTPYSWDGLNEVLKGSSGFTTVKGNLYIGWTSTDPVTVFNNNGHTQPMLVLGDLYIGSGSTFSNDNTNVASAVDGTGLEVYGNLIIEGTYAFDNSSTGTTILSGSSAQTISSTSGGTFHTRNFELDNGNGATLDGIDVNISNTLTFTDGIINTDVTTSDIVNITNTSVSAIVSGSAQNANNRYVNGKLQWSTVSGSTYTFPIGSTPGTYGAQGFDITIDAGSGAILGYLETNNTSPIYGYAYCDFEDHPGSGSVNVGGGMVGYDGILDQATFDLSSDLQWDVTNTSGSVTQYDITVLATGNQDINPAPHVDNLAVTANGVEVRYLMKNGEPGNPGVATTTTVDFPQVGFDLCPTQYTLDNLTSFSKFTLDGPSVSSTALPAELIIFDAKKNDKVVDLYWQTASEQNTSHFIIERSGNGSEFVDILSSNAAGNSSVVLDYFTIDFNPLSGINYYRLKTYDNDGSFKKSEVRTVVFNNETPIVLTGSNDWRIMYKPTNEKYTVEIYNSIGQIVGTEMIINTTENGVDLSHLNYERGTYFLVIKDGDQLYTLKVIK